MSTKKERKSEWFPWGDPIPTVGVDGRHYAISLDEQEGGKGITDPDFEINDASGDDEDGSYGRTKRLDEIFHR